MRPNDVAIVASAARAVHQPMLAWDIGMENSTDMLKRQCLGCKLCFS